MRVPTAVKEAALNRIPDGGQRGARIMFLVSSIIFVQRSASGTEQIIDAVAASSEGILAKLRPEPAREPPVPGTALRAAEQGPILAKRLRKGSHD